MATFKRREDDILADARGIYGDKRSRAMRPGQFFAFGSDAKTGKVGRVVSGQLNPNDASGDRIGNALGGGNVGGQDLRTGVNTGMSTAATPRTPFIPRGASSQSPINAPGQSAVAPTTMMQPSLKKYSALNSVMSNRRNKAARFDQLQRNPSIAKPAELLAFGIDPSKSGSRNTQGKSVAETWKRIQDETAGYNAEVSAAQASNVDFARTQENEAMKAAVAFQLQNVKGDQTLALQDVKGEQDIAKIEAKAKARKEQITLAASERLKGKLAAGEFPGTQPYQTKLADELVKMAEEAKLRGENATTLEEQRQAGREELEIMRAAMAALPKTTKETYMGKDGNVTGGIEKTVTGTMPPAAAPTDQASTGDLNKDGKVTAADQDIAAAQKILTVIRTEFPDMKPADIELKLTPDELRKYRRALEIMKGV